jgi:hypothetical protein
LAERTHSGSISDLAERTHSSQPIVKMIKPIQRLRHNFLNRKALTAAAHGEDDIIRIEDDYRRA